MSKSWIGERYDAEAGLQYLNARYYDPELAMFIQPDWWEVTQAGVGTNRYSYTGGDPVNGIDPGGNQEAALILIAEHSSEIEKASTKYGVDPQAVASIIFQENYWGFWKDVKNVAPYFKNYSISQGSPTKGSFGLTEVNISLAQELAGIDPKSDDAAAKAYELISDPETSIDFAARYLSRNEEVMGMKLQGSSGGFAHNMGAKRYADYLDPTFPAAEKPSDRVSKRGVNYQYAIAQALNGYITLKPDDWENFYGALEYNGLQYWLIQ